MPEVPSLIGVAFGFIAILTAIFALRDQRKQTRLMEAQLDKRIEVKITRDLEAADLTPEGAPRSAIDSQLRTYLNTRLSRVRADMRDEFNRRLNEIAHKDGDLAVNAVNVMSAHDNAIAKFEESNNRMGALEQQVQALQHAYDDIRSGVGNPAMVRTHIRGIAEQLLRMTGEEYGV